LFEAKTNDARAEIIKLIVIGACHTIPEICASGSIGAACPAETGKTVPPSMKKGKANDWRGKEVEINMPDGMIGHLTRDCTGNVHDGHVVNVTSGSLEKDLERANPDSGRQKN
jgi:hypothetical protein